MANQPGMADTAQHEALAEPAQSNGGGKQRAACDQCRQRKLKCSGEPDGCARCHREGVRCIYSLQKPMGRPRKRRREGEHDFSPSHSAPPLDSSSDLHGQHPLDPALLDTAFPEFPQDAAFRTASSEPSVLPAYDFSLDPMPENLFDPNLAEATEMPVNQLQVTPSHGLSVSPPDSTASGGKCFCLSTMFLASSELRKDNNGIGFPLILAPLKRAISKADDILHCDVCPQQMTTLRENTLLLVTLLNSIASAFDQILRDVDSEASNLELLGSRKALRMGEMWTPETAHLHTGTLDCPMGINVELEPAEWRALSYRATKNEVFDRGTGKLTLESLLNQLEARQEAWHIASGAPHKLGDTCACIKMLSTIRLALRNLPS